MWPFYRKGPSGFSSSSTAEEVTKGIDGSGLTAIVTVGHKHSKPTSAAHDTQTTIVERPTFTTKEYNQILALLHEGNCNTQSLATGASSGIGSETARILALRGVNVIMGVRNMAAGKEVKEAIVKEIPAAKVDTMELDLSSMTSVRKFASDFTSSSRPLNLLINNAGVMATPFKLSKDNIELQFATNHLGHFLLTHLLIETMKKTARETKREGRIVNVSSEAHRFAYREGIRFDRLNDKEGYNRWAAYGQSKLANILHANELARRLKEDGAEITANSLHPGTITTNLFRNLGVFEGNLGVFEGVANTVGKFVFKNIPQGASTSCYLALHPQVKGISGEYFSDNNLAKPTSKAADTDLSRKLWDFSMDLIK